MKLLRLQLPQSIILLSLNKLLPVIIYIVQDTNFIPMKEKLREEVRRLREKGEAS